MGTPELYSAQATACATIEPPCEDIYEAVAKFDCTQAHTEGWDLEEVEEEGLRVVIHGPRTGHWYLDDDALTHVQSKAESGSAYHQSALALVQRWSEAHAERDEDDGPTDQEIEDQMIERDIEYQEEVLRGEHGEDAMFALQSKILKARKPVVFYDPRIDAVVLGKLNGDVYAVELSRIPDFQGLLEWVRHLAAKEWAWRAIGMFIDKVCERKAWQLDRNL